MTEEHISQYITGDAIISSAGVLALADEFRKMNFQDITGDEGKTYSAAQIKNGYVLRRLTTGAVVDTLPTAAQIIASYSNAVEGKEIHLVISNGGNPGTIIEVYPGDGITMPALYLPVGRVVYLHGILNIAAGTVVLRLVSDTTVLTGDGTVEAGSILHLADEFRLLNPAEIYTTEDVDIEASVVLYAGVISIENAKGADVIATLAPASDIVAACPNAFNGKRLNLVIVSDPDSGYNTIITGTGHIAKIGGSSNPLSVTLTAGKAVILIGRMVLASQITIEWQVISGNSFAQAALAEGKIFIGDINNNAVQQYMHGDATLSTAGALSLADEFRVLNAEDVTAPAVLSVNQVINSVLMVLCSGSTGPVALPDVADIISALPNPLNGKMLDLTIGNSDSSATSATLSGTGHIFHGKYGDALGNLPIPPGIGAHLKGKLTIGSLAAVDWYVVGTFVPF